MYFARLYLQHSIIIWANIRMTVVVSCIRMFSWAHTAGSVHEPNPLYASKHVISFTNSGTSWNHIIHHGVQNSQPILMILNQVNHAEVRDNIPWISTLISFFHQRLRLPSSSFLHVSQPNINKKKITFDQEQKSSKSLLVSKLFQPPDISSVFHQHISLITPIL
jgi:hypothetical protein